jgi:hypothetical protein
MASQIAEVAAAKPKTGVDMTAFINRVLLAMRDELGVMALSATDAEDTLRKMQSAARNENRPERIGTLYGKIKGVALESGATDTAAAITKSAKWFYDNVEKPSLPAQSSGGGHLTDLPGPTGDEDEDEEPFYKQTWFLVGAPVTLAVILGLAIVLWPSDDED